MVVTNLNPSAFPFIQGYFCLKTHRRRALPPKLGIWTDLQDSNLNRTSFLLILHQKNHLTSKYCSSMFKATAESNWAYIFNTLVACLKSHWLVKKQTWLTALHSFISLLQLRYLVNTVYQSSQFDPAFLVTLLSTFPRTYFMFKLLWHFWHTFLCGSRIP